MKRQQMERIALAMGALFWGSAALALSGPGQQPAELGAPARLQDVASGTLLLTTTVEGVYLPAPILHTDVEIRVTGMIARARVSQWFLNPTEQWVEGIYVFPLPERAAVDTLRMVVGDRVIEGRIEEREVARRTYEAARRQGRRASLVAQDRPNVFTTSIANLGPGEEVEVILEYQEELRFDDGRFSLRFPLVVAPRYLPASGAEEVWGVAPHSAAGPLNPVTLQVELESGLRLRRLESSSHRVEVASRGGTPWIRLSDPPVAADRDFVLEWEPAVGVHPDAAVFAEEIEGEHYVLVMVLPPRDGADSVPVARETVFVMDTSGSMAGESMRQARQALLEGISRLRPGDRFNVIQFNSVTERLFEQSVPVTPWALEEAADYVRRLQAGGGTEMLPALAAALDDPDPHGRDLRQVVFVTDGLVANEDQLFSLIRDRLGRTRLFTVGIGSAPNSHFMRRAAELGRGTFTYIGSVGEVASRMGGLLRKLEAPALHDLEVDWGQGGVEAWPQRPPDLYMGEPVVLAARLANRPEELWLRGLLGDEAWELRLPLPPAAVRSGVAKVWARRQIAALSAGLHDGVPLAEVRRAVLDVALRHHLVSQFTSLVAVDVTTTAPEGSTPRSLPLPVALPTGWSAEQAFDTLPQGGTRARLQLLLGGLIVLVAGLLWRLREVMG